LPKKTNTPSLVLSSFVHILILLFSIIKNKMLEKIMEKMKNKFIKDLKNEKPKLKN